MITAPAEAMEAKRLPPVRTSRKPLEVRATYAIKRVRTNFPVNRETNVERDEDDVVRQRQCGECEGCKEGASTEQFSERVKLGLATREGSAGSVSKGVACELSDRGAQGGDCCDRYEAKAGVCRGDEDDEQQVWDGKERNNIANYAGDKDA